MHKTKQKKNVKKSPETNLFAKKKQTNKYLYMFCFYCLSWFVIYLWVWKQNKTKQNKNPIAIAKYKSFEIESVSFLKHI